jgi:hypothetical protein
VNIVSKNAVPSFAFTVTDHPEAVNDDAPGANYFPWRTRYAFLEESALFTSMAATVDRLPAKPWFSTRPVKFSKTRAKDMVSALAPDLARMGDSFEVPPAWNLAHHSVAFVYCRASLWLLGATTQRYLCVPSSALVSEGADAGNATTPLTDTIAKRIEAAVGPDQHYMLVVVPDRRVSEFLVAVAIASRHAAVMAKLIAALGCDASDVRDPYDIYEELYSRFGRGPGDARSRQMLGGVAASQSVLDGARRLYEEERAFIPLLKNAPQEPPDEAVAA